LADHDSDSFVLVRVLRVEISAPPKRLTAKPIGVPGFFAG
jgi:hypothetical protein